MGFICEQQLVAKCGECSMKSINSSPANVRCVWLADGISFSICKLSVWGTINSRLSCFLLSPSPEELIVDPIREHIQQWHGALLVLVWQVLPKLYVHRWSGCWKTTHYFSLESTICCTLFTEWTNWARDAKTVPRFKTYFCCLGVIKKKKNFHFYKFTVFALYKLILQHVSFSWVCLQMINRYIVVIIGIISVNAKSLCLKQI